MGVDQTAILVYGVVLTSGQELPWDDGDECFREDFDFPDRLDIGCIGSKNYGGESDILLILKGYQHHVGGYDGARFLKNRFDVKQEDSEFILSFLKENNLEYWADGLGWYMGVDWW